MEKFARYLAAFDGTQDWATIELLYDDLFHPDCVVVTADGELNKEQWASMAKGLAERKATASDFEVTSEGEDSIAYRVTISVAGEEPLHMTAKATVREGQLFRVEPVDPKIYSQLVERST